MKPIYYVLYIVICLSIFSICMHINNHVGPMAKFYQILHAWFSNSIESKKLSIT